MRYSKLALLVFGAGCVLGLVVVAVELPGLARVASLAMALGIAALPVTILMDLRRRSPAAKPAPRRKRRGTPTKRRKPTAKARSRRKR
jgi:hypothetical protein